MARLSAVRDERGAVYVEFLIAFFPLFILFLGICQLALIAAAETVVRHAAYSGVRTAVVALDDHRAPYDKINPGTLSEGRPSQVSGFDDVIEKLGIRRVALSRTTPVAAECLGAAAPAPPSAPTGSLAIEVVDSLFGGNSSTLPSTPGNGSSPQQGVRMVPIRTAALLPLLPIAPSEGSVRNQSESVNGALTASSDRQLGFAAEYTKSAALVTVHDSPESESLALEPIGTESMVSVRVTYLFHCAIPLVRSIMCSSPFSLANKSALVDAVVESTLGIVGYDARFRVLTATATLPNQGAVYQRESGE